MGTDGIKYLADATPSEERGFVSDFGKQFTMNHVDPADAVLYQTERYHTKTFSYNIPIREDGKYAAVLKFSEVYFSAPGSKVFEVQLNGETVIDELDIFKKVGKYTALDEIIEFKVVGKKLYVREVELPFSGKVELSFVKLPNADNPKVCAIAVVKGGAEYVSANLADDLEYFDEDEDGEEVEIEDIADLKGLNQNKNSAGSDPYSYDLQSMAPLVITFGLFFISIFSLTKMTGGDKNKQRRRSAPKS